MTQTLMEFCILHTIQRFKLLHALELLQTHMGVHWNIVTSLRYHDVMDVSWRYGSFMTSLKYRDVMEVSWRRVVICFYQRLKRFKKFAFQLFIVYVFADAESR